MAKGMTKLSQLKGVLKDFEAKMKDLKAEEVLEFKVLLAELNTLASKALAERKEDLIAFKKKEQSDYVAQKQKEIEELEKL